MSTLTRNRHPETIDLDAAPAPAGDSSRSISFVNLVAIAAMVVGVVFMAGGVGGAAYTWGQASDQNITTPGDASIANAPVRGPFTMLSQMNIITHHQLDSTDGLYYSEMSRQVAQVDADGNAVIGADGEPVMVNNDARTSWLAATGLTTALGLGIIAYGVSAMAFVLGLVLIGLGYAVRRLTAELSPAV